MKLVEPFGLCQNYPTRVNRWHLEHDLTLLKKAGVRWLRTEFDWRKLEPKEGEYRFEWFDTLVELCSSMQIHLVPVVAYSPKWVAPRFNIPPKEPDRYASLFRTLAERYGHYVRHWEVWNEANSYYFWVGDALQYALLFEAASEAIKEVRPDSSILTCGLADPASPDTLFLSKMLSHLKESGNNPDVLNLHAYPGTWNVRRPEDWPEILRNLYHDSHAGETQGLRVWITETGLSSHGGEMGQSSYLIRAFASLFASGVVERVFWYRLKDTASRSDQRKTTTSAWSGQGKREDEDQFGLLNQTTAFGGRPLFYRGHSKLSRTLPAGVGRMARAFFKDRRKSSYAALGNLVALLGDEFECTASSFSPKEGVTDDGTPGGGRRKGVVGLNEVQLAPYWVSFVSSRGEVRVFWSDDEEDHDTGRRSLPLVSVSGGAPVRLDNISAKRYLDQTEGIEKGFRAN